MQLECFVTGALATNTYILTTNEKNAVVIDPGDNAQEIFAHLQENGITLKKILLTHGHYDHTMACSELMRLGSLSGGDVFIHHEDSQKLVDRLLALPHTVRAEEFFPVKDYTVISDNDVITQDELEFHVIHTPGHTAGGVTYKLDNLLFVGDTMFFESYGATADLSADVEALMQSLKKLLQQDADCHVLPGHGPDTTVLHERTHNPCVIY